MTSCCPAPESESELPRRRQCPVNDLEYSEVSAKTIAHHLAKAWKWTPSARKYYFCGDPECDVVYFGDDNSVILKSQLRTRVGVKERCGDDLLCYCFGVTRADVELEPSIKNFVTAQTKAGLCTCETSNPSGRCCLRDFPKIKE